MMKKLHKNKLNKVALIAFSTLFSSSAFSALVPLGDEELGEVTGQASLINIDKYDFDGGAGVNNFYRIKLNSVVETSLNIDELYLRDKDDNIQIGIQDLSLSGGLDGQVSNATITNPYVEFAFAGSLDTTDARNREIIGIRLGADEIDGVLSFGDKAKHGSNLPNLPNGTRDTTQENGLSHFRGYLETKPFNGEVQTLIETRTAIVNTTLPVCGGFVSFGTCVGITINAPTVGTADIETRDTTTGDGIIRLNFSSTGAVIDSSQTTQILAGGNRNTNGVVTQAFLQVEAGAITIGQLLGDAEVTATALGIPLDATPDIEVNTVRVSGPNTSSDNDTIPIFIKEDLRFLHNVEAVSAGGFLSAQNRDVAWKNFSSTTGRTTSYTTEGWWMEFLDPLDLGDLTVENFSLPQNVIQGIGNAVNDNIAARQPPLSLTEVVGLLTGDTLVVGPLSAHLARDQNTGIPGAPLVSVIAQDISIATNQPIINCWNGTVGC